MADEKPDREVGGTKDTTEYSASKAPETKVTAEQPEVSDPRLIPGGRRGAESDVGMSAMEREDVPSIDPRDPRDHE